MRWRPCPCPCPRWEGYVALCNYNPSPGSSPDSKGRLSEPDGSRRGGDRKGKSSSTAMVSGPLAPTTSSIQARSRCRTCSRAWASPDPSKLKHGILETMNSSSVSNIAWRLGGVRRKLQSLSELGRLRTSTNESNYEGSWSSKIFPQHMVPTQEWH